MDAFWYTHHNGVCHMADGLKTTLDVSAEKRAVVESGWLPHVVLHTVMLKQ